MPLSAASSIRYADTLLLKLTGVDAMSTAKVISLSVSPKLAREAERVAKQEGRTRSELVREALIIYLAESKWRELRKYGAAQVKKLGITEDDVERLVGEYRADRDELSNLMGFEPS